MCEEPGGLPGLTEEGEVNVEPIAQRPPDDGLEEHIVIQYLTVGVQNVRRRTAVGLFDAEAGEGGGIVRSGPAELLRLGLAVVHGPGDGGNGAVGAAADHGPDAAGGRAPAFNDFHRRLLNR